MGRIRAGSVAPCLALVVLLVGLSAGRAEVTQADKDLLEEVARRLLAVTEPVPDFQWPPTFEVVDNEQINAFASARIEKDPDGKRKIIPRIVVDKGMMQKVVQGDEHRLAFILGHELGHVLLRHILSFAGDTPLAQMVFSRQEESAADRLGMELALKAGFNYRRGVRAIQRMIELGLNYSSFEGLKTDHPSWRDRVAFFAKEQAELWKAMSAFDNGVVFLVLEQYGSAEECFRRVVARDFFPDCYEAWANLGYALLMQYCDKLDADDLRQLDVGHLVCGGFYRRPASLEAKVRGKDRNLWQEAVEALKTALQLKPDLTLAKANLGLAYLVHPDGKDLTQALKYLQDASDKAGAAHLDPLVRVALLINLAVADLAAGRHEVSARKFDQGEALSRQFTAKDGSRRSAQALSLALLYNRALLLSASGDAQKRQQAVKLLEEYLRTTQAGAGWWPLAYERYQKLCQDLGVSAKAEDSLKRQTPAPLRVVTAVQLGSGVTITLSEAFDEVAGRLGKGQAVPVVAGTNLARARYPDHGLELLVAEQVLAICLRGPKAPALPLRGKGLGSKVQELRVGMTVQEVEQLLEDPEDYDMRQLDNPDISYRFYPALGLAVRIRQGKVEELVVAQIPRRRIAGE
jgi:predicted Zn-dependent protease